MSKDDNKDEGIGAESLSDEAAASVREKVEQEQRENAPQPVKKGGPLPGMPAETDFTTPRVPEEEKGRRRGKRS